MIKKEKIFELRIEEDDDLSGIDSISLVDEPAIEVNWVAFNKQKPEDFHIPDGEDNKYLQMLIEKGQNEQDLLDEGFEVVSITEVGKNEFITAPDPNELSGDDTMLFRVRYRYGLSPNISESAIIPTTRDFCKELINKNYVWRVEDIESTFNEFGQSAQTWRGGYNCRHRWFKILYKNTGNIINKASVNKEKVTTETGIGINMTPDFIQPSTVTNKTLGNPSPSTIRNLGLNKQPFAQKPKVSIDYDGTLSTPEGEDLYKELIAQGNEVYIVTKRSELEGQTVLDKAKSLRIPQNNVIFTNGKDKSPILKQLGIKKHYDNSPDVINEIKNNAPEIEAIKFEFSLPYFDNKDDAEKYAIKIGCEGSHEHVIEGRTFYMPCKEHPEDMGYDVGGIGGYVDPGIKKKKKKVDANEFINQFEYLFESYSDYPESVKNNAKAVLKWVEENGWGSCGTDVGKQRANQLANGEPISFETIKRMYSYLSRHEVDLQSSKGYGDGCGKLMYDSWGGKTALSWAESKINAIEREKMSKQYFQTDDEKRIVLGPAMIPNLNIFRRDKNGEAYYVYFTAETIKMIAEKYMRNKYIDNNDENHDGKAVSDVYVIESWIKEDEHDKSNKYGFENLPIGTWFVSMKVRNEDVWQKIKNRELNGFSVSGFFEEVKQFTKEEMFLYKVAEIIKNIK